MLGKTAGGLYWMFRYIERSENTARLIAAGQRIGLTHSSGADDEWRSVLQTAAVDQAYFAAYPEINRDSVVDWLLRDRDNASSVMSVIEAARNNARVVRTALTREVWESINGAWMTLRAALARKVPERDLPEVLALIRQRTAYVRGAMTGTMLRNDIYNFARIGTFIERADNTARILDVKYYVLLPSAIGVGSAVDNVQWASILRSVSAEGGFRLTFGQDARPREIAQFLILDKRMPRSLSFCADKIRDNLGYLVADYGDRMQSHDMADRMCLNVMSHDVDDIFELGLHEFIQGFVGSVAALGGQIEIDYRFAA